MNKENAENLRLPSFIHIEDPIPIQSSIKIELVEPFQMKIQDVICRICKLPNSLDQSGKCSGCRKDSIQEHQKRRRARFRLLKFLFGN